MQWLDIGNLLTPLYLSVFQNFLKTLILTIWCRLWTAPRPFRTMDILRTWKNWFWQPTPSVYRPFSTMDILRIWKKLIWQPTPFASRCVLWKRIGFLLLYFLYYMPYLLRSCVVFLVSFDICLVNVLNVWPWFTNGY